ncbi:MAG TPA: cation-translocating P-type ATPase, partial [Acidimicrobiales bacterium]|nr:cation-translocating P-type ATPase [Acidimicrobiales bacterium]
MTLTDDRPAAPTAPRREVTLAVDGMTCGGCAARIERRLNRVQGVSARVNLATERATVTLDETVAVGQLIEEVAATGYAARPVPETGHTPADDALEQRARSLGRRLIVAAALFMPLCDLSIAFWLVPTLRFPGWQWLLVVLAAPVVGWAAWPFYAGAARQARHRTTTMDTLVSVGILSSVGWSLYAMFWRDSGHASRSLLDVLARGNAGAIYLDVAAGVTTFLLAGRYYEAVCRRRAGSAARSLAGLAAKEVSILDADDVERRRPLAQLAVGDRFVVRPGETVAADGTVAAGSSWIDCSAMTGEAMPTDVAVGDRVTGGTLCIGGRLVVEAAAVGDDTQLATMMRLVTHTQDERAAAQRLADRIAGVFVPAVLVAAAATLFGWLLAGGGSGRAVSAALSVLIIACPCALGLATPAALMVAAGEGARLGVFFKGYRAFERSREIDTVVLDKTGTLTWGRMSVGDVTATAGVTEIEVLAWAGSVEQASEHPIGRAITAHARRAGLRLEPVTSFAATPAMGVTGTVAGHVVTVRSPSSVGHPVPDAVWARCTAWQEEGKAVAVVG